MSVRAAILVLLDRRAGYGYQLKQELMHRVEGWSVNVGQIYNTLERLCRDGQVERAGEGEHGQVLYRCTSAGSATAERWWSSPCAVGAAAAQERVVKASLAVSLPGVDARSVCETEITAVSSALAAMQDGAGGARDSVAAMAARAMLQAQLEWLHAVVERIGAGAFIPSEPLNDAPRRGRPGRVSVEG